MRTRFANGRLDGYRRGRLTKKKLATRESMTSPKKNDDFCDEYTRILASIYRTRQSCVALPIRILEWILILTLTK